MALAGLDLTPTKLPPMQLIPPREAEAEGVVREEGPFKNRIIYTETVLDIEATKESAQVKLDAQGNEVWKKHPTTGEAQYPILKKTPVFKTIRYILVPNEHARTVKKIQNFEMTAEEKRELERREKESNFLADFIREAVKAGFTPAEVVRRMRGDLTDDGEDPDAVDIGVTEEEAEALASAVSSDAEGMLDRDDDDAVAIEPGTANPEVPFDEAQKPPKRRKKKG